MAAEGHFSSKSHQLMIKHYAEDIGYDVYVRFE